MGLEQHFDALCAQNKKGILADYTNASEIQAWSSGGKDELYSRSRGLVEIGDMFQARRPTPILRRPQFEFRSFVGVVWSSYSDPKATDTFSFVDHGNDGEEC